MSINSLHRSKKKDIENSVAAMRRAALRAWEIGRTSGTGIVVMENGKNVRISAEDIDLPQPHSESEPGR
jgi:hypothetical protein